MNRLGNIIHKAIFAVRPSASGPGSFPRSHESLIYETSVLARPNTSRKALAVAAALGSMPVVASIAQHWKRREHLLVCSQRASFAVQCSTSEPAAHQLGVLHVQFCGKPKTFTPIYDQQPGDLTASVNAGDYGLYVGGGSINLGFAKLLGLDPKKNAYKELHAEMAELVLSCPGSMQEVSGKFDELGLLGCFGRAPAPSLGDKNLTGIAFLDVFDSKSRPLSDKNVAMLYVVGPKGQGAVHAKGAGQIMKDCDEFLAAVQMMSENALNLVCEYNQRAAHSPDLPQVSIVQFCLVSGGVYKHADASKVDVATAIVKGLAHGATAARPGTLPVIRFPYDDAAFEEGCRLAAAGGCLLNIS